MKMHAPLLPLAIAMMAGIAMSPWVNDWLLPLCLLALVVIATFFAGRYPRLQTAGIWLAALLLGTALGSRQRQQLNVEWPEEKQQMELVVVSEVKVKEKTVVFDALTADGQHKLRCSIQRDWHSKQLQIGHGLLLHARIKKIHEYHHGHFDYLQYMQCHGFTGEVYANSHQWQWKAVGLQALSVTDRLRLRFLTWRHQLLAHFQHQPIDEDAYGVIAAMTLGEKSVLSKDLKDTYSRVGASHILALSGLHLMIIYSVVTLVIGWHRYRIATQTIMVLALWAFALLTGLSTSVVRSAFMISIYALLSLGYRERMSVNTLAFVGTGAHPTAAPLAVDRMGTGDGLHSCTDRYGTPCRLPVRPLQHVVPAQQLHRRAVSMAHTLRHPVVPRSQLVVVGSGCTHHPTRLADRRHEPRTCMGGAATHEQHRGPQPHPPPTLPYLSDYRLLLCGIGHLSRISQIIKNGHFIGKSKVGKGCHIHFFPF